MRGELFHRVDLVFLGDIEKPVLHGDANQVGWDWLDISTLNSVQLYPSKLRRQITNLFEGKRHRIYLDNESVGDQEATD